MKHRKEYANILVEMLPPHVRSPVGSPATPTRTGKGPLPGRLLSPAAFAPASTSHTERGTCDVEASASDFSSAAISSIKTYGKRSEKTGPKTAKEEKDKIGREVNTGGQVEQL